MSAVLWGFLVLACEPIEQPVSGPVTLTSEWKSITPPEPLRIGRRSEQKFCPMTTPWQLHVLSTRFLLRKSSRSSEVSPLGIVLRSGALTLVCTFWDYSEVNDLSLHRNSGGSSARRPCQGAAGLQPRPAHSVRQDWVRHRTPAAAPTRVRDVIAERLSAFVRFARGCSPCALVEGGSASTTPTR